MPITYATQLTPDSATIAIFNTDPDVPGAPGSTLWVDEISLKEWTTDVPSFKEANFEMYPNPSSEKLTIQLPSGTDNATVEFYDYVGRLALSKKITRNDDDINVNNLSTGIYVLKVLSENKIGSQKFIKK